jgi:hypothetical protein
LRGGLVCAEEELAGWLGQIALHRMASIKINRIESHGFHE